MTASFLQKTRPITCSTSKTNVERMTQMIDDIPGHRQKSRAKVLQVRPEFLDIVNFCQTLLNEREFRRPKAPIALVCRSPATDCPCR